MIPLLIILFAWLVAALVYWVTRSTAAAAGTAILLLGIAIAWKKWSIGRNR